MKETVTTILVRFFDKAGNKYDHYSGALAGCPPIPRVGEYVNNKHLGDSKVIKIEHETEDAKDLCAYSVLIYLESIT